MSGRQPEPRIIYLITLVGGAEKVGIVSAFRGNCRKHFKKLKGITEKLRTSKCKASISSRCLICFLKLERVSMHMRAGERIPSRLHACFRAEPDVGLRHEL